MIRIRWFGLFVDVSETYYEGLYGVTTENTFPDKHIFSKPLFKKGYLNRGRHIYRRIKRNPDRMCVTFTPFWFLPIHNAYLWFRQCAYETYIIRLDFWESI